MTDILLTRPVFVRRAAGLVQEIASIADAIDFLEDWTLRDRDLIHDTALRTLVAVHDGRKRWLLPGRRSKILPGRSASLSGPKR